ncbi:MAG: class IV adenylate cyclase [Candidatus Saccharimonadales bacterium]
MQKEIEAKFLDVDFDDVRKKLEAAGAVCLTPMRLMRRVTFDSAEMKARNGWVRVRDEGDRVTVTYKQVDELSVDGVFEVETIVEDFDAMVDIFKQTGIADGSFQESKRETWELDKAEIVLDEWPWLKPYIEIEGKTEEAIREVAKKLDFDWDQAKFGDVMVAYRQQYPHLKYEDTVGNLAEVRFGMPMPDLFKNL